MSEKTENPYMQLWLDQQQKFVALIGQKQQIEAEMLKIRQLMKATYNLVPDEEKEKFAAWFRQYRESIEQHEQGLTEAIRNILQESPQRWFSPVEVRDLLQETGFNFGDYTSNPLSSIHSVLKRFKSKDVKKKNMLDGTKRYRWVGRLVGLPRPGTLRNLLAARPTVAPPPAVEEERK